MKCDTYRCFNERTRRVETLSNDILLPGRTVGVVAYLCQPCEVKLFDRLSGEPMAVVAASRPIRVPA